MGLREAMLGLVCGAAVALTPGPSEAGRRRGGPPPEAPALQQHVLDRAGFGPGNWSRLRIRQLGARGYLLEQLAPHTIDDADADALLARFPSLPLGFAELRAGYGSEEGQLPRGHILRDLQRARILRSVASRRQLNELLVDFWFNHFNVNTAGNRRGYDISPYERLAIRPHVLGAFEDLLLAVARSPAMGDYLDNRRSQAGAINENYARELMELHTLGVEGGFSEADVVEVARCFTGWMQDYAQADGFRFRNGRHDGDAKSIMGALQIPAGAGEQDGRDVVHFLATHPSTAEFVSRKLVRRFVSETPPPELVASAAAVFLATDGDLRAVMQEILLSDAFLSDPNVRGTKVKRPLQLLASTARALGADPALLNLGAVKSDLDQMGELLFQAAPPTGYPDASGFWTSPGTVVLRFNALERAARGLDGYTFVPAAADGAPAQVVDALIHRLFVGPVSPETRDEATTLAERLARNPQRMVEQTTAFLLSSPEFLSH